MFRVNEKTPQEHNKKLIMYLNNIIGCGENKQISKSELADRLGVTKSTINKWLDGSYPLNNEYADKICEVLNLDRNMFTDELNNDYDFILRYSTLNVTDKKKILEYIDFLFYKGQEKQKGKIKK